MARGPEDLRTVCDPDADTVIGAFSDEVQVAELLEALIRWNPNDQDYPHESADVRQFLDAPWSHTAATDEQLVRACKVFADLRLPTYLILACASLPECYAHPEVAGTLIGSGRLAQKVRRRLRETAEFVDAVMKEGAWGPEGKGVRWARKVRLIHATQRHLTPTRIASLLGASNRPLWDALIPDRHASPDQHPIDQVELAFVLQTFAHVMLRGWRHFGARLNKEDADAWIAVWSVVGQSLGIAHSLLPSNAKSAKELFKRLQTDADKCWLAKNTELMGLSDPVLESGALLASALSVLVSRVLRERVPRLSRERPGLARFIPGLVLRLIDRQVDAALISTPRSMIRDLISRPRARRLLIGRAPFWHWIVYKFLMTGIRFFGADVKPRSERRVSRPWRYLSRNEEIWRQLSPSAVGGSITPGPMAKNDPSQGRDKPDKRSTG